MGRSRKGKSLKASLASHQKKQAEKTAAAQKHAALQDKGRKRKPEKRYTIPFTLGDRILLVGEGDFSFANSLLDHHHHSASCITATAYDSESTCLSKYPDAESHISALRAAGVRVLFDVDATALDKTFRRSAERWDKVVWNFPHAGAGITDMERNVVANQQLLLGFLKSVAGMLETGDAPGLRHQNEVEVEGSDEEGEVQTAGFDSKHVGSVLITLREREPYTLWDLPRLAKNPIVLRSSESKNKIPQPRYVQVRSFAFHSEAYPGYEHRRTAGWDARERPLVAKEEERGTSRTWEFALRVEDALDRT